MKTYTWHFKINPAPASRPRITRRGGRYYGKVYTEFRNQAQEVIPETDWCTGTTGRPDDREPPVQLPDTQEPSESLSQWGHRQLHQGNP